MTLATRIAKLEAAQINANDPKHEDWVRYIAACEDPNTEASAATIREFESRQFSLAYTAKLAAFLEQTETP